MSGVTDIGKSGLSPGLACSASKEAGMAVSVLNRTRLLVSAPDTSPGPDRQTKKTPGSPGFEQSRAPRLFLKRESLHVFLGHHGDAAGSDPEMLAVFLGVITDSSVGRKSGAFADDGLFY